MRCCGVAVWHRSIWMSIFLVLLRSCLLISFAASFALSVVVVLWVEGEGHVCKCGCPPSCAVQRGGA